ncbi:MAG: cysteine desulfurase family protein [Sinimarinibacterium flocculans]|uniref:Cysteine desulfurase n=1 Tax=Sinimarinibacterium flocculans TaxID=985250 RepID=A0A318E9T5_9GAMM|nr:cysteine desulfurase family protein [Sinimarinibacterium flocculans]PXV66210.1 cysteine desulfurase [Sinimarinibacterium flocculans]
MPAYLDHNATTRVDPRVLEAMLPYLSGPYGNASSLHRFGRAARDAVERARVQVASLVGAQPGEVVWTSGGTESNNLAIKGVAALHPGRVLYGATEHPAVMEAAEALGDQRTVEAVAVDGQGLVDWPAFARQLERGPVALVALMRANNETGVIQDVARAAPMVRAAGARLHVDAVQAAGKMALDFEALGADLMSLSSHKLYGPKGIGALVRRAGIDLWPLHHGGPQEKGLRGGTENVAAIVGFGEAAELAEREWQARAGHVGVLRERLEAALRELPGVVIFGAQVERLPNTVQFALPGYDGEALLMQLDRKGFAVSSGSACASGKGEPSHVLLAMGLSRETARGAIRVSLGVASTAEEVDGFVDALRVLGSAGRGAVAGA